AQDIGLYVFTAIVASIPIGLFTVMGVASTTSESAAIGAFVLLPVALVATAVLWTALILQMNERLQGREPALGPSIRRAFALMFRVVWAAIIAYVLTVAAMFVCAFGIGILAALSATFLPPLVGAVVVIGAGIALFLFVAARIFAGLFLFLPGITVENLTAYASIKRGYELARGSRGRILAVLCLSWLLVLVPVLAVMFLTGTATTVLDPEALATGTVGMGRLALQQLLAVVASGFTTPYLVACILLVYFDQRVRREAYDLQSEAEALAG
ncbi:MAG TPA: hypothetical protein VFQ22_06805, partial [Longimicrobiales bacterium]|nr:hypothetical protein [Longimicrobiales bacterium]